MATTPVTFAGILSMHATVFNPTKKTVDVVVTVTEAGYVATSTPNNSALQILQAQHQVATEDDGSVMVSMEATTVLLATRS